MLPARLQQTRDLPQLVPQRLRGDVEASKPHLLGLAGQRQVHQVLVFDHAHSKVDRVAAAVFETVVGAKGGVDVLTAGVIAAVLLALDLANLVLDVDHVDEL